MPLSGYGVLGELSTMANGYFPPPSTPRGFPGLRKTRPKTAISGDGRRRRWKDDYDSIYEWDYQHGTLERYDRRGRHAGEFDPDTGRQTKPADPTRTVEP